MSLEHKNLACLLEREEENNSDFPGEPRENVLSSSVNWNV